jgi:cysteine desulfurase
MEPSHVLRAMKVPYTAAHGAVRFSLSRETTADDVERVLEVMPEIIDKLRGSMLVFEDCMSPAGFHGSYA